MTEIIWAIIYFMCAIIGAYIGISAYLNKRYKWAAAATVCVVWCLAGVMWYLQ